MTWAVELLGHEFDLQDASELFASGGVRVESLDDKRVLLADDLGSLTNATQVHEAAKRLVDLVNGALFLHDAAREPVRIGAVRENRNGKWNHHYVLVAEGLALRSRLGSVVVSLNGVVAPAKTPPERAWVQHALSDDVVADVLSYLRERPDWFELYKAFEYMRDDINRRLGDQHQVETMGWPGKSELDHFTESANVHRHSPPKWGRLNPTTAMNPDDARPFIARLARIWLEWRT
jgi:hypothetical protein